MFRATHRPSRTRAAPITLCAALVALLVMVPGCGRRNGHPVLTRTTTARPAVRGADRGLEIWSWAVSDPRRQLPVNAADPAAAPAIVIRDDKTDIESLLSPYLSRPVPMSDAVRERWRASGLRVVAVPVADLDRLLNGSRLVGTVQRQWLGETPAWTEAARGPASREPRTVTVCDGPAQLEPGRLRLLVRAWTVPVEQDSGTPAAGLHMDLSPRLDPFVPEHDRMMAAAAGEPQAPPHIFSKLAASLTIAQGDALVIIPDSPGADWARPAPDAAADEYGPQTAPLPTLGEALMASSGSSGAVRTRAVVALVPHIPDRFELIAR